jgi:L-ascorbate metabolism protein UlaG (beta-lactamase superfamily)
MSLAARSFEGTLAGRLRETRDDYGLRFYWLGQAGFLIAGEGRRIVIDPYLSDSLAEKYRGKVFTHERMMPAPIEVNDLSPIDLVLVTHQHTDHMDQATLTPLAAANPGCRFVVPRAAMDEAMHRTGAAPERLVGLDAGEVFTLFPACTVTAVRAAHETLERSPEGFHRFLGYVIEIAGRRLYHSGDTIPFDGQAAEVAATRPDVALLPVNGRRAELSAAGIAGNLTLEEARTLAGRVGAVAMVAHHYGMFAFNSVSPDAIDRLVEDGCAPPVHRARTGVEYRLS